SSACRAPSANEAARIQPRLAFQSIRQPPFLRPFVRSLRYDVSFHQMLGIPGNRIRESMSAMSFSHVMPGLHSDSGLSVTTVSVIDSGAGSVAVFARP